MRILAIHFLLPAAALHLPCNVQAEKAEAAPPAAGIVLPLHVQWKQPDGSICFSGYRVPNREGEFQMALPIAVSAPQDRWQLAVRSQLNGGRATLPVTVAAGAGRNLASPLNERISRSGKTGPAVDQRCVRPDARRDRDSGQRYRRFESGPRIPVRSA